MIADKPIPILLALMLGVLPALCWSEEAQVGDWQFETRSTRGGYSAFTYSASGHYGKSRLQLNASPQKQGPCHVQLSYSLYGPYAITLKGLSLKARVDQDTLRQVRFGDEQSGRTREGIKFTTGHFDLNSREAQTLVAEMLEGKWLRLRLNENSEVDRFSLAGFGRAAQAIFYFCKTPNAKDRYPLTILLEKQDDDDYL